MSRLDREIGVYWEHDEICQTFGPVNPLEVMCKLLKFSEIQQNGTLVYEQRRP